MAQQLRAHVSLSTDAMEALDGLPFRMETATSRRGYQRGLKQSGDVILSDGAWIAVTHLLPDGRQAIVTLFLPGDIIALGFPGRMTDDYDLMPVSDGRVLRYEAASMEAAVQQHASLAEGFLRLKAHTERQMLARIAALLQFQGYERMAYFLFCLSERLEQVGLVEDGSFRLPLSQSMIGSLLGLHEVHVSRLITRLETDGFIERSGGRIHIPDRAGLAGLVQMTL